MEPPKRSRLAVLPKAEHLVSNGDPIHIIISTLKLTMLHHYFGYPPLMGHALGYAVLKWVPYDSNEYNPLPPSLTKWNVMYHLYAKDTQTVRA